MRFFDTKIAKRLDDSSEVSLHHGTGAYLLGLLFRLSLVVRPRITLDHDHWSFVP